MKKLQRVLVCIVGLMTSVTANAGPSCVPAEAVKQQLSKAGCKWELVSVQDMFLKKMVERCTCQIQSPDLQGSSPAHVTTTPGTPGINNKPRLELLVEGQKVEMLTPDEYAALHSSLRPRGLERPLTQGDIADKLRNSGLDAKSGKAILVQPAK